jgi:Flp pilus assembly protein TadD
MHSKPVCAPLYVLRGEVLGQAMAALEAGRFREAEAVAGGWVAREPGDLDARLLLGLAIAGRGEAAGAAPLLQAVAEARPGFAHPCRDLARLCPDAPSLVAAQYRACRALAPTDRKLGYAYADFLLGCENPAAAAAVLRGVLETAPAFGIAHNLFGMALYDLGDIAGAVAAFRRATELDPEEAAPWANLGMALKVEGRFDAALAACDRAVARAPGDPQIRLNRAVALLRAGRMTEAWPDYEARMALGGARLPMVLLLPAVAGLNLSGRTVLVWHEEGFGDTLQFCRYIRLLAVRGARVVAWVPAELARLFATLDGVAEVLTGTPALPPFDWHCPFFSLPRAFATTLHSIPNHTPYLRAESALAAAWAARLPRQGDVRVGLVWAGQARPWVASFTALDRRRSTSLATLAPLGAVAGARFVSLQKGPPAAEARCPPDGLDVFDPMGGVTDFADTAAIIAALDVVVSVDTAVAHLAAAMGTRVLLLDRYDSCWRWLAGREDSPWYPSLRILRQPASGDWASVVARAAAILAGMADERGAAAG